MEELRSYSNAMSKIWRDFALVCFQTSPSASVLARDISQPPISKLLPFRFHGAESSDLMSLGLGNVVLIL